MSSDSLHVGETEVPGENSDDMREGPEELNLRCWPAPQVRRRGPSCRGACEATALGRRCDPAKNRAPEALQTAN